MPTSLGVEQISAGCGRGDAGVCHPSGAPWQGCPLPLAIAAPSSAKRAPGKESWRARPRSTWALIGFGTAPSGPVGRPAHPLSLLSMLLRGSDGISLAILWSLHRCDRGSTSFKQSLELGTQHRTVGCGGGGGGAAGICGADARALRRERRRSQYTGRSRHQTSALFLGRGLVPAKPSLDSTGAAAAVRSHPCAPEQVKLARQNNAASARASKVAQGSPRPLRKERATMRLKEALHKVPQGRVDAR